MVLLVLFSNFFSVFFSSVLWVAILVKFFLGENLCYKKWQLPRSAAHQWCHHLLAINPCNYPRSETSKWVVKRVCLGGLGGWDLSWVDGLRLRYSYYSWDFYFLCFFSWMNVDSSSCHGSGHDFMVRSLLLYFFAKQLHSTSSPERLKHLCKKAPTSKETNKTSNKKRQKPSCKVPSDHAQDPSVTDVFHRGNAILGTGSHHAIGCHALGCWEEVLGVQRLIFFWRSVGRSKQGGWNWLASRQLSTPRLLPAALLFAPWARCLL